MKMLIREFPDELHKALKIMAAQRGMALYRLIIMLLDKAVRELNK